MGDAIRQANALAHMLNAERAHGLSLTASRLEAALAEWRRTEWDASERGQRLTADARREAARQLWNLIVQREALGLSRHDDVYEQYAVPRSLVPSPG